MKYHVFVQDEFHKIVEEATFIDYEEMMAYVGQLSFQLNHGERLSIQILNV